MKSFKKYLNENNQREEYEKNRREMLDSIHSMSLEDAEAHGQLDLVSGEPIFTAEYNANNVPYTLLKPDHAFTKYLTHPKHSDESVLEDLNFLMKMAHQKDNESGIERVRHRGNRHQADVYRFTLNHFPAIAHAMGKTFFNDKPRFITNELNTGHPPIQVTPELLQNLKKQHGTVRVVGSRTYNRIFVNANNQDIWFADGFGPSDLYDALSR